MIGRLNHVAIATNDIKKAAKIYRDTLGGNVSEEVPQPDVEQRSVHICTLRK